MTVLLASLSPVVQMFRYKQSSEIPLLNRCRGNVFSSSRPKSIKHAGANFVAFKTRDQGPIGLGFWNCNRPIGGSAYGIPKNVCTVFPIQLTVEPVIGPTEVTMVLNFRLRFVFGLNNNR